MRNALAIGNEFAADCDGVGHARIMIVLVARDGRAAVEALRGTATYKEGPAQGRERQALLRDGASWASPASDTLTDDMPTTTCCGYGSSGAKLFRLKVRGIYCRGS